ncbi:uncharacterized protein B0H64DRAFT_446095 [Chaetomium fimeti]|uniref:Uncharacterized protein n=1 Tax=Chaetomium fimeti TaxID=1854472 RepID=A0AAE0LNB5_9PEZI|nr:hypothetical protein B0H64DRAFT_446095 [Chaetomium fimeti]
MEHPKESPQGHQGKYRIYLVGFPDTNGTSKSVPVAKLIDDLVPEAEVINHSIFRGDAAPNLLQSDLETEGNVDVNESNVSEDDDQLELPESVANEKLGVRAPTGPDLLRVDKDQPPLDDGSAPYRGLRRVNTAAASTTSVGGDAHDFTPGWLEKEALGLLNRIEKHRYADVDGAPCQVVLAGHEFGGLVLKQYPIANFVPSGQSDHLRAMRFGNGLENVVFWTDHNGDHDATVCATDDIGKMESLRTHFAPQRLLLKLGNEGFIRLPATHISESSRHCPLAGK